MGKLPCSLLFCAVKLMKELFVTIIHAAYSVRGTFCASLYGDDPNPAYTHILTRVTWAHAGTPVYGFLGAYRRGVGFVYRRVFIYAYIRDRNGCIYGVKARM